MIPPLMGLLPRNQLSFRVRGKRARFLVPIPVLPLVWLNAGGRAHLAVPVVVRFAPAHMALLPEGAHAREAVTPPAVSAGAQKDEGARRLEVRYP